MVEERDPDLDDMDDIRFEKIREDHWRDLGEESNNKKKIHALRWCVYVKEKEELITRSFSVSVPESSSYRCLPPLNLSNDPPEFRRT